MKSAISTSFALLFACIYVTCDASSPGHSAHLLSHHQPNYSETSDMYNEPSPTKKSAGITTYQAFSRSHSPDSTQESQSNSTAPSPLSNFNVQVHNVPLTPPASSPSPNTESNSNQIGKKPSRLAALFSCFNTCCKPSKATEELLTEDEGCCC